MSALTRCCEKPLTDPPVIVCWEQTPEFVAAIPLVVNVAPPFALAAAPTRQQFQVCRCWLLVTLECLCRVKWFLNV